MADDIIIDDGEMILPCDYEKKLEEIKKVLDEELFDGITEENTTITNTMTGMKFKRRVMKNELMPMLSELKVATVLNKCLRTYLPLTLQEAKSLSPKDILAGFKQFMELISYINKFISFIPDKQLVSAFLGMTTNSYTELMKDPHYSEVFASIEDYLVSMNFIGAQSGLSDGRTVLSKLQTQGQHGHNLVKSADAIQIVQNATLDRKSIAETLGKYMALANGKNNKK